MAETVPFDTFGLVVVPVLIFLARICDVSVGTVRIIFVARGYRYLAPLLGFVEVVVWLMAIGQVMKNLTSWPHYLAYGLGFAVGNYVGILIEARLAIGHQVVRVITRRDATALVEFLRQQGYGVTVLDAQGSDLAAVKIIFTIASRRDLPTIVDIIKRFNPNAFYSVGDVRFVAEPEVGGRTRLQLWLHRFMQKAK